MENKHPKATYWSEISFSKTKDGGRPPYWISIFGRNFGVDPHFFTEFGTQMKNQLPKETHLSQIKFSKIHNLSHDLDVN